MPDIATREEVFTSGQPLLEDRDLTPHDIKAARRALNWTQAQLAALHHLRPHVTQRGILQWSLRELAERAGVAFSTVHRFEKTGNCSESVEEKIKAALALEEVEITNGNGTGARLLTGAPVEALDD